MRLSLKPHPDTPCEAVAAVEVEIDGVGGSGLALTYELRGSLDKLLIPPAGPSARADRLWQHSCFEIFIRPGDGEEYWEFNFAPSQEWAAYRLSGYRKGMIPAPQPVPPIIEISSTEDRLEVRVRLESGVSAELPWKVGLSAVVEDRAGVRSFWALAHPAGEPDFHSPDCFALELAPPKLP